MRKNSVKGYMFVTAFYMLAIMAVVAGLGKNLDTVVRSLVFLPAVFFDVCVGQYFMQKFESKKQEI